MAWTKAHPKSAVRSPPICSSPVGLGAKRVRTGPVMRAPRCGWGGGFGVGRGLRGKAGIVDGGEHVAGEGRGHGELAAGGVGEGESPGVEEVTGTGAATVQLVAGDGGADGGEVDADLVGAAREGLRQDQRAFASGGEHLVLGLGAAAVGRDGHAAAVGVAASDVGVDDGAVALRDTVAQREVLLVRLAGLEGGAEGGLGRGRLREEQDAAGVLVEAVDDAGALHVEGGSFARVVLDEPGGDAGSAGLGGGVVDEQSGGLVDGEKVVVPVQDGKGETAGGDDAGRLGKGDGDLGALLDVGRLAGGGAVDEHVLVGDEALDAARLRSGKAAASTASRRPSSVTRSCRLLPGLSVSESRTPIRG